jgi:hypothetical protein
MGSIVDWLRSLFAAGRRRPKESAVPRSAARERTAYEIAGAPREEAEAYLDRVQAKLHKLAEDFNAGTINRAQFQNLYIHYQREIRNVEELIEAAPASEGWKNAVTEGHSVLIRRQHVARAKGYAVFENDSGMPVSTLGRFELDPALLVPMLSSYRSATQEIFGAGTRSTEMEDGRWLCFVPGEFTTMLAVFTTEPAGKQLLFLEELHRHFEQANRRHLAKRPLDRKDLLFPHEYFLGHWRR